MTKTKKRATLDLKGFTKMKNIYLISILFLIGCSGSPSETACYDCGEPMHTGGDSSMAGSPNETGGTSSETGGTNTGGASGGSLNCVPKTCDQISCGQTDDGCGNTIICGCATDSVCGGENSRRITEVRASYSKMDYTVEGTANVCSNTCTQQLQLIVIEDFCGIGTSDTLWACPNFYGDDIPQMLTNKNCITAPNEPFSGAFCCLN